ncbi:cation efflux protein/ zinc transporter [Clonorchis sinensis]|uniref:Cation efflux protein/ zinc transporter n=1 Tax=Clonorchis sinensis TaxID=79923 RepID=G7YUR2_CLOSI|nr:cation efflux protein/ zinc transporter [Clonorchis sinensis]
MSSIHVAVGFFCQPMSTEDNCYLIDEGNYRLDIPDERTPLSPSRRFADTLRGHCHDDTTDRGIDKRAKRKLLIASGLCLCFMIGEVVGLILFNQQRQLCWGNGGTLQSLHHVRAV